VHHSSAIARVRSPVSALEKCDPNHVDLSTSTPASVPTQPLVVCVHAPTRKPDHARAHNTPHSSRTNASISTSLSSRNRGTCAPFAAHSRNHATHSHSAPHLCARRRQYRQPDAAACPWRQHCARSHHVVLSLKRTCWQQGATTDQTASSATRARLPAPSQRTLAIQVAYAVHSEQRTSHMITITYDNGAVPNAASSTGVNFAALASGSAVTDNADNTNSARAQSLVVGARRRCASAISRVTSTCRAVEARVNEINQHNISITPGGVAATRAASTADRCATTRAARSGDASAANSSTCSASRNRFTALCRPCVCA
jgi:hypothetical protein